MPVIETVSLTNIISYEIQWKTVTDGQQAVTAYFKAVFHIQQLILWDVTP